MFIPGISTALRAVGLGTKIPASYETPGLQVTRGGFSSDFKDFLGKQGLGNERFLDSDRMGFGGKTHADETSERTPVIFVHGNSDDANSWQPHINYFATQGYKPSELYAMTWGPGSMLKGVVQPFSVKDAADVRTFANAVLAYTGAKKVSLVGHSMGGPLSYEAAAGGKAFGDRFDVVDLGAPLPVERLVSVAGVFRGSAPASALPLTKVGSLSDGVHPLSRELAEIRSKPKAADRVYDISTVIDEVVGPAWSVISGRAPHRDGGVVTRADGHMGARDKNIPLIYDMTSGSGDYV